MKSDHRHELKTNELAEWIGNLPQWARENRKMIIYVSAVAVLVIGSASWYWYNKNVESVREQNKFTSLITQLPQSKMQVVMARARGVDTSIMLLRLADNLRSAAQSTKDDQMAALALIKQAEALRTELHYRPGTVSKPDLTAQINQAKAAYAEAIKTRLKGTSNPSLMATAKFGLGLCEEELGNFEEAEQIYRELAINTDFEGTIAIAQAKQRLKTMADYKQKVVFKASPKPRPADFLQPPIQLGPADTNLADADFVGTFLADINLAEMYVGDTNLADANLVDINPGDTNLGDANQTGP